ncbi:MAG TPA: roadblock/LC7 domain-containing protein [Thermoanaerobaculia bacterium]|nr:roadblock/LC7 domain-containing protein [Thermoanaerobaculia bacterium]
MSSFSSRARELREALFDLSTRVREIRGLMLVDQNGLVLVSTFHSAGLEEGLAALAGAFLVQMERAQGEFQMGPLYFLHLAGRDRQLLLVPVNRETALVAAVEAGAPAATIAVHLLAIARQILDLALEPRPEEG